MERGLVVSNNDIQIIQNKSIEILKELVQVFENNNLTYYLSGGSFLGAVRHQGFIPWDDDIDISMPRKDYDFFLKQCSQELSDNLFVQNFETDTKYRYYITRVLDSSFNIEEIRTGNITHPAVDILPLDGSPNNDFSRYLYLKKIMFLRYMISLSNRDIIDVNRKRGVFESAVVSVVRNLPFERVLNEYKLKKILDRNMKKYIMSDSLYSGCLMGAYRVKQMVPTKWFGRGKDYQFENMKLNGPENYDAYLKQMYGEYMKIPDQSTIDSKIHYRIKK